MSESAPESITFKIETDTAPDVSDHQTTVETGSRFAGNAGRVDSKLKSVAVANGVVFLPDVSDNAVVHRD